MNLGSKIIRVRKKLWGQKKLWVTKNFGLLVSTLLIVGHNYIVSILPCLCCSYSSLDMGPLDPLLQEVGETLPLGLLFQTTSSTAISRAKLPGWQLLSGPNYQERVQGLEMG